MARKKPRKNDTDLPRRTPDVRGPDGRIPPGRMKWHDEERRYRRGVWLTCETPGCLNSTRSWFDRCDDNADGIWRVQCGLCGEWIEAIVEHPTKRGFTHKSFRDRKGRDWDVADDDDDDNDDPV